VVHGVPGHEGKETNRIVTDDAVAAVLEFTGMNTGPMTMAGREIPPTGKTALGKGAYFARIQNGKTVQFSSHPRHGRPDCAAGFMPQM
jgi:hypothetical protein